MPIQFLVLLSPLIFLIGCDQKDKETIVNPYSHLVNKNPDDLSYEQLYNRTLSLWDVPFEETDLPTSYGSAHIITAGPKDAPPLILLHGMNSSSTVWYPNIESLSQNHRIYAIDFILETNKSHLEGELKEVDQIVSWYYEIIEQLNLNTFSLVGASMGGWLAMNVALEAPERINKLVLISPAQAFIFIPPSGKMLKNMFYSKDRDNLHEVLQTITYDVNNLNQLYIDQYYRGLTIENPENIMMKMRPFKNEALEKLTMPILLLIGDDDFINNKRSLQIAQEHFPNVRSKMLHSRHFITMDQTEKVNRFMVDFLVE